MSSSIPDGENTIQYIIENQPSVNKVTSSIQQFIHSTLKSYKKEWKGKLYFNDIRERRVNSKYYNILRNVGKNTSHKFKLYFPLVKYSPSNGFKGTGFQLLVKDLQLSSMITSGFSIVKGGTAKNKKNCMDVTELTVLDVNYKEVMFLKDLL